MTTAKVAPEDLRKVMRKTYDELIEFVTTDNFKSVLDELYGLPEIQRPNYVNSIILNKDKLLERGVDVPEDILIQRSSFGDLRPTLFVVKKYLPDEYKIAWENVNLTFDQKHDSSSCSQEEKSWKTPLPMEVQAALTAMNISSSDIEKWGK